MLLCALRLRSTADRRILPAGSPGRPTAPCHPAFRRLTLGDQMYNISAKGPFAIAPRGVSPSIPSKLLVRRGRAVPQPNLISPGQLSRPTALPHAQLTIAL